MACTRRKNIDWILPDQDKEPFTWDHARMAVLMDIRANTAEISSKLCQAYNYFGQTSSLLREIRALRRDVQKLKRKPKKTSP